MLETLFILLVVGIGRLFTSPEEFDQMVRDELEQGLEDGSIKANMRGDNYGKRNFNR